MKMETNNLYEIIAPAKIRIEKPKWDKIRWAWLIFFVGFVIFVSIYIGHWYIHN